MADLVEIEQWDNGVYQLETTDPVQGGEDGVDNTPHKALANRTLFLKNTKADITYVNSKPTGYKNLLINANGLINQRGYVSGTATVADNEYTLDRWRVVLTGEALTFSTVDNITTFTAPLNGVEQIIEDINVISGNYTLSFTGTATATISQSSDNVTYTAVTANTDGSYPLVGGLYTKVTLIDGTFSLIQLEQGIVATPFENRPKSLELSLCNRYYVSTLATSENDNIIIGEAIVDYRIGITVIFPNKMRVASTASIYSPNGTIGNVAIYNDSGTDIDIGAAAAAVRATGFVYIGGDSAKPNLTTGSHYIIRYTADAEIY